VILKNKGIIEKDVSLLPGLHSNRIH
jgi:hypothetical protein